MSSNVIIMYLSDIHDTGTKKHIIFPYNGRMITSQYYYISLYNSVRNESNYYRKIMTYLDVLPSTVASWCSAERWYAITAVDTGTGPSFTRTLRSKNRDQNIKI
jgi:hypothetical protein